jgi:hypothetical protein
MGVFCLLAASDIGDWLSIGTGAVRETGVVFLVAAAVGAETAIRRTLDVRWIAGANIAFALWCLGVIGFDDPDRIGTAVLGVSAAAALGTALLEWRLGKDA